MDRKGSITLLMALTMPILLLAVAGAIEVVHWTVVQRTLQRTADLAALAGAVADFDALDSPAATTAAADHARLNGLATDGVTVQVGPGVRDSRAVTIQVSLVRPLPTFLSQRSLDLHVHALAWAEVRNGVQPCILALAANGQGVSAEGDQPVTLSACAIRSNAAISTGGTPITASGFYAGGAIAGGPLNGGHHPNDGTIADPYAGDAAMEQAFANLRPGHGVSVHNTPSLHPGTYANWQIDTTTKLAPGFYQVNGDICIGASGKLTGQGVTIVSSGTIQMTGSATLSLAASHAGALPAVAYASNASSAIQIGANHPATITGTVYLPNADLTFSGAATSCLRLIAKSVKLEAGTAMAAYCQSVGGPGFSAEDGSVRAELVR